MSMERRWSPANVRDMPRMPPTASMSKPLSSKRFTASMPTSFVIGHWKKAPMNNSGPATSMIGVRFLLMICKLHAGI